MARKKKGELPSGNIRRQVFIGYELVYDPDGKPILDDNGKPKKKRKYASVTAATTTQAERDKTEIKVNRNSYKAPSEMTLREAIEQHINTSDAVLSPTTIRGYRTIQENAFVHIMDTRISSLTKEILKEAVNIESKRLTKNNKQISAKTVKNEYGLISSVIKANAPNIDTNVKLPAVSTTKHELSTPDVIFNMVKGTDIELPVLLAMWLSFSLSEIRGLCKSKSISSDGNYISIVQVTVTVGKQQITKNTAKQETRHRTHKIPPYIKELIDQVTTDQLVTMSANAVYCRFRRLIKKHNLPYMTFHDLRHVSASVMKLLNVPDKYAQERGGWKTDHVMKGTYMQTFSTARVEVDNSIDQYFEKLLFAQCEGATKNELVSSLQNYSSKEVLESLCKVLGDQSLHILVQMQHEMQHEMQKNA